MADANKTGPARVCPWCSAPVPPGATRCPACGDSLAQRESIDGLAIPGVTVVEPALGADAERPLRVPLATPANLDPFGGGIDLGGVARLADLAAPLARRPLIRARWDSRPRRLSRRPSARTGRTRRPDAGVSVGRWTAPRFFASWGPTPGVPRAWPSRTVGQRTSSPVDRSSIIEQLSARTVWDRIGPALYDATGGGWRGDSPSRR